MAYHGFDMTGKVAALTGSTSGIGLAIARGYAQCGAAVIVSSHDQDDTAATVALLRGEGFTVEGVKCDITAAGDVASFHDRCLQAFGRVDALTCLAAAPPPQGPIGAATIEEMDSALGTVRNNLLLIQKFLPGMAEQRYGSIVLMSSIASIRANPVLGLYGAAKAALNGIVRGIGSEWGAHNVRANAIAPSVVRTPFSAPLWDTPEMERKFAAKSPANRIADADDIVGAAILLSSPAGAYINGQTLLIDGGRSII
jgi:NAD(P)-dependent dehydrogenase (short-subunit alcohol dehydrogenase family)